MSDREQVAVVEEKKRSGIPIGLIAFAPFIFFGCASGANYWRIATGGGLIISLTYLAVLRRRGATIKLMDWTTLAAFVIGAMLTIGLRWSSFPIYNEIIIWSCFAVAAWGSIVIGRPFTAAYARESAPPEFWKNPIFARLNLVMSLLWSALLTVNVGLTILGVLIGGLFGQLVPGLALPMLLLILGFAFNTRFPPRYLARAGFSQV
jgi:intracellular septation protein A